MKTGLVLAGCLLLAAPRSRAQNAPAPEVAPERRLATEPATALTRGPWGLTLAAYHGYDAISAPDDAASVEQSALLQAGQQQGLTARFAASRKRVRTELAAGAESTLSHYTSAHTTLIDVTATARESTTLGRRTTVAASQRFGYAPYQSLGLFPGFNMGAATDVSATNAPTFQQGVGSSQVFRYDVAGQLARPVSGRNTLEFDYQRTATLSDGSLADTAYQEAGIRLMHQGTRTLGYHLGYAYAESAGQGLHHFRIGLDGRKALSRSRRTVFSFGTDSTLVRRPPTGRAPTSEFRLLGNADLDHYFARSWSARLSYRRDVAMIEGYATPVFREWLVAGTAGTFTTRTTAGVNGAWVLADLADQQAESRDRAVTGTAWMQVQLQSRTSLYGEYVFYAHRAALAATALGLPARFTRNSVHVGVAFNLAPAH